MCGRLSSVVFSVVCSLVSGPTQNDAKLWLIMSAFAKLPFVRTDTQAVGCAELWIEHFCPNVRPYILFLNCRNKQNDNSFRRGIIGFCHCADLTCANTPRRTPSTKLLTFCNWNALLSAGRVTHNSMFETHLRTQQNDSTMWMFFPIAKAPNIP